MVNSEGAAAPAVPPVQKRLTEGKKDHWRMVDRMLAHILAKVPPAVCMSRLCASMQSKPRYMAIASLGQATVYDSDKSRRQSTGVCSVAYSPPVLAKALSGAGHEQARATRRCTSLTLILGSSGLCHACS